MNLTNHMLHISLYLITTVTESRNRKIPVTTGNRYSKYSRLDVASWPVANEVSHLQALEAEAPQARLGPRSRPVSLLDWTSQEQWLCSGIPLPRWMLDSAVQVQRSASGTSDGTCRGTIPSLPPRAGVSPQPLDFTFTHPLTRSLIR